jgi:hypothetical protein
VARTRYTKFSDRLIELCLLSIAGGNVVSLPRRRA